MKEAQKINISKMYRIVVCVFLLWPVSYSLQPMPHQYMDFLDNTDSIHDLAENMEIFSGTTKRNALNLTALVINALEKVRPMMKTGNSSLGIPILDPNIFNITDSSELHQAGRIDGAVKGISDYIVQDVKVFLASLTMDVSLLFPELEVLGYYNLSGSVADILPLYGHGDYKINLYNFVLNLNANLKSNATQRKTFYMSNFTEDFYIGHVKLQLGDFLGGGGVTSVMEGFLTDALIQILYNKLKGSVATAIGHTVMNDFNTKFTSLTMKDIVQYLNKF